MKRSPDIFTASAKEKNAKMTAESRQQQHSVHLAVGALIAGWANTESAFLELARILLRTDEVGATIAYFSLSSNYARMNFLNALGYQRLAPDRFAELVKLIDRFKSPTTIRNELAHAEYMFDLKTFEYVGTASTYTTALEKRAMVAERPFDKNRFNEIKTAIANLNQLNSDIWAFRNAILEGGA